MTSKFTVRGKHWEAYLVEDLEARKKLTATMFRNNRPTNDVFVLARVNKLSVLTVREIEAEYLQEIGDRK
ncbi:hypothetical protein NDK43_26010 [Neobacillus pocheonensis]|uniref:Uncharacterized protein n=1 Tax=Neobacillus pocheonensis TaxID=363869 RepID=A0ABT0WFU4_9BACI|nr:hypothetical protein [Neobacillus pocheonensis]